MTYVIEQIKARINISSVISKKVNLKRKSNGEFVGLCPFHHEKSPSFTVSDNKGLYHCFGCGVHGDVFSYIMNTEHVDFKEALEKLANDTGVELPKLTEKDQKKYDQHSVLIEIHEATATYYTQKLFSKEGKLALDYLKKRGLKSEVIAEYRLGYSPNNSDELYSLLKSNFNEQDILTSKIISLGSYGYYNPLKHRVIFPIFNKHNRVIAFGGRILDNGQPKYLNSPETPIFKKSEQLYGLNFARKEAVKLQQIIVVEGYMDVLSLVNSGIQNVAAPLGTSISVDHIKSLWGIVNIPIICMDADKPGKSAMIRLANEILPYIQADKTLKFTLLEGGKDPDEVISNHGTDYLKSFIDNSHPLSDLLFNIEYTLEPLTTPEAIASLKKRLEALTKKIADQILQRAYFHFFNGRLYERMSNKSAKQKFSSTSDMKHIFKLPNDSEEKNLIAIFATIANHPELIQDDDIYHEFHNIEIKSTLLEGAREYIFSLKDLETHIQTPSSVILKQTLLQDFKIRIDNVLLDSFTKVTSTLEEAKEGIQRIMKINHLSIIQKQIKQTSRLLLEDQDEKTYEKLNYLKSIEEKLKTQLSLLN